MMTFIEKAWKKQSLWLYLLAPFSLLFWLLSVVRRTLFKVGIKTTHRLPVPVVVVGNISVGGNGKTPAVLAIVEHLQSNGFSPGILSRGYGAMCKDFPYHVQCTDSATWAGDEPLLMAQQALVPVVIDPNRVRGGQYLAQHCDVIICDDGLQHYALHRDIEIVVMDERRVGNGWVLPVGNLRELPGRLRSVDFVILNSASIQNKHEIQMQLVPQALQPVNPASVSQFAKPPVEFDYLMTGIGNPQRFEDTCDNLSIVFHNTLFYPDHFHYRPKDVPSGSVIMTQKDAVKCAGFALAQWYYLPVKATFSEHFLSDLTTLLNTRTPVKPTNGF
jgi:tetraacyldisaccharide 4'-kinase